MLGRTSHTSFFGKPTAADRELAHKAIEFVGIESLMDRSCSQLSGGQYQMVLIARALAAEPELLVMDEPESNLDFKNQLKVLEQLPELSWLTVNLNGSIAEVETQVRAPAPEITNKSGPSNLKASCDGTIVEIEVYDGQPMVQKNDAVAEGMLLVSGVVDSKAGPILKRSRARIIAETQHDIVIRLPLEESRLLPNGRVISRPVFQFFGLSIPLYTDGPVEGEYIEEFEKNPLTANGLRLPIGLATQRFILQDMQTITRTPEQAAAEAAQLLEQQRSLS